MGALVVEELLAASVTDAVVGEKGDEGVLENAFPLQALHHFSNMPVRDPNGIEVGSPVLEHDRISRIIGRQNDF